MMSYCRKVIGTALFLVASVAVSSAQVPTRTLIHFTINVPVAVTIGNCVLAPGTYELYQDSQIREMFALYRGGLNTEPIAQILTNQTPYWAVSNNRETRIELRMTESSAGAHPAVKGFNVPFADRWDIVSVVAKHNNKYITRIR